MASREPRPPTLLDAAAPVVVLIGLLATTIALFGVAATDGPLQVALLLSAAFASLVALKNGHRVASLADAAVGGVTTAMGAIFILLAVGSLIGTWNLAGTIPTVWLILGALSFAAVMEHAGLLQRLLAPLVARTKRRGTLILAVNGSGVGLNLVAGDQYVADVLPSRMFRDEFARRGLAPQVLSRAVEDSGTVTSVLVPWNTCGAYISGVLGVPTAAYLPFCFFNIASPLLDVLYGFIGFKVPTAQPEESSR
jgi:NhaC family Na+:H+ antiporter